MPISQPALDRILDLRPIADGERAEVRRGLGPMVEVESPSPVARVQRGQLPTELGLWRGYYERLWVRGSPLAIHRLPDLYGGLYLLIERQAADGTIARCRLKTFGSRNRLGFVPACDGMGGLSVMLPLAVAANALGVPAEALNDRMVPLEDLWGPAGRLLEERLAICRDDVDRMAIFNRMLRGLLARGAADRRVFATVRAIEGCSGTLRIDALAESLGLGRRSLERLFAGTFGIGPKRYARAVRLQQAIGRLIGTPASEVDWTALALDVGCYDQSHLIHEFQEFTGMGPGAFSAIPGIGFTLAFGAVLMQRPGGSWRDRNA